MLEKAKGKESLIGLRAWTSLAELFCHLPVKPVTAEFGCSVQKLI